MKLKSIKFYHYYKKITEYLDLEALIWLSAILYLTIVRLNPEIHFSICPLHNLGLTFCPGCGLGHSVSYFLHGEFERSIQTHWLGPIATIIIVFRIIVLIKNILIKFPKFHFIKEKSW